MAIALTLLFLLPGWLVQQPEQEPAPPVQDPGFVIGVAVDQVFLSVNARSFEGGFVRDLTREDFQVFEDGVRQEIVNFDSEQVPVKVVLVVDVSGSTRASQGEIRRAAMHLVRKLGPEDQVAVITFNHQSKLVRDWTGDPEKIELALQSTYARGITVMNDAIYVTFDDLLREVDGRTAVVLFTDGVDTGSTVTFEQAFNQAVRSEAMVYVVSLLDQYWAEAIAWRMQYRSRAQIIPRELSDEYILQTRRSLDRLAKQTGGRILEASGWGDLAKVYGEVADELKNQYYISYVPSNVAKDGQWREIEIRVNRPGVVVSTRPGYFAPLGEIVSAQP